MSRFYISFLCGLIACSQAVLPAFADDEAKGEDIADALAFTTVRLAKFGVGFTVGTPVAIVRKTLRTTANTTKKLTGDKDNDALAIATEALVLPFGTVVGSLEGVGWAASNCWKNSEHDKALNKDLFCLGEMED